MIQDNGIGMSRDEVVSHIGTIAKSGTRELMQRIKESKSGESVAELIGQFGVGFYSAFMVADRISLLTRRAGETGATLWQSSGDGTYTLAGSRARGPRHHHHPASEAGRRRQRHRRLHQFPHPQEHRQET